MTFSKNKIITPPSIWFLSFLNGVIIPSFFRQIKPMIPKLLFFVFACMLPVASISASEEVISEKRIGVAMRMIGHEVLLCMGDTESRVMPIEKIDDYYKIPFEFEFGFDPDDVIDIVTSVMTETNIGTHYLVEVEQCETKEVVHSFIIGNATNSHMIACGGRVLPEDCYSLLITIFDGINSILNGSTTVANSSAINGSSPSEELSTNDSPFSSLQDESPFKSAFLIVPLIFLIGFIGYFIKKKNPEDLDPNLIWIGASKFDKRNRRLSFENKSVELSNKEAELLLVLHMAANSPIEREVILERVWGDEGDYVGRTLDVFISKLRKKLEADASVKIVNIRGVGYKLVMDIVK